MQEIINKLTARDNKFACAYADLPRYKDSMRPLIEKEMAAAQDIWNR